MNYFTKEQLTALIETAEKADPRTGLMLRVAFNHGLRASEVVSLTSGNVRGGYIVVQRLKNSLKTVQALLDDERDQLTALAKEKAPFKTPLFPISRVQFWRLMQKYGEAAGLPPHLWHPHALKHTTAVTGLNGGMKINEVQQYLGHKSGASTMQYLKVDDEIASKSFMKAVTQTA